MHFVQKGPPGGNGSKQVWRQGSHGKLQECRGCAAAYGAEDELLGLNRGKLHVKRDAVANIKEKAAPAHDRPGAKPLLFTASWPFWHHVFPILGAIPNKLRLKCCKLQLKSEFWYRISSGTV